MITSIDKQFLLWEKQNQPRRAQSRISSCSSDVACQTNTDTEAEGTKTQLATSASSGEK